jgi:hypothetical protein
MKRGKILGLRELRWLPVVDGDDLEVAIVPSEITGMGAFAMLGAEDGAGSRDFCTRVFVNFRNYYEDDGTTPIKNSVEARLELYAWGLCRRAINEALIKAHSEIAEGEAGAASD